MLCLRFRCKFDLNYRGFHCSLPARCRAVLKLRDGWPLRRNWSSFSHDGVRLPPFQLPTPTAGKSQQYDCNMKPGEPGVITEYPTILVLKHLFAKYPLNQINTQHGEETRNMNMDRQEHKRPSTIDIHAIVNTGINRAPAVGRCRCHC